MDRSPLEGSDDHELAALPHVRLPDEEAQVGGDPGPSIQPGVQLQNKSGQHDSSSDIGPEESARLWAEVKAETGYDSYEDYLVNYVSERRMDLWILISNFDNLASHRKYGRRSIHKKGNHNCAILDVHDKNSACSRVTLQCSSDSGTKILSALRQPLATARVRIVLLDGSELCGEMVDALGLGLRIQPRFFQAFIARHSKSPAWLDETSGWRLAGDVVFIGSYVMTIVRNYLPARPDAAPTMLIVGPDIEYWKMEFGHNSTETFPFHRKATPARRELTSPTNRLPLWMNEYVSHLESDLEKGSGLDLRVEDLSLILLTPLVQFSIFQIRVQYGKIRSELRELAGKLDARAHRPLNLFKMRSELRRLIEDSEDTSQQLQRFKSFHKLGTTLQDRLSNTFEEDLRHARIEALRLETETRDYLQLQTGELALKESRKSIELSNSQIEEAKRGWFKRLKHWGTTC